MQIIDSLNSFIANIPLGSYYHLYFSVGLFIVNAASAILAVFFTAVRRINKTVWGITQVCALLLVYAKAYCDAALKAPPNEKLVPFCILLTTASAAFYCAFTMLKSSKLKVTQAEKRLIDRLLCEEEDFEDSAIKDCFSQNPFRRVEVLQTQKGFDQEPSFDFNINPSYIKLYLCNLLKKPLNVVDKREVEEIKSSFESYSLKKLSNFERDDFSTKLQRLLKLTAKYDTANSD